MTQDIIADQNPVDYSAMPLFDEQAEFDQPASQFKPMAKAQADKKKKNRDKAKYRVPAPQQPAENLIEKSEESSSIDTLTPSGVPDMPRKATDTTISPTEAVSALLDDVPDMFNTSARVAQSVKAIIPMNNLMLIVGVAAIAGLAVYLDTRRNN